MKKLSLLTFLLFAALYGEAQSFTVTGPRTYYSTERAHNVYQYFNFDKGKTVLSTDNWHMALYNSEITFNTTEGVEAQILTGTSFASQTTAPTTGYTSTIDVTSGTGYFDYTGAPAHIIYPFADKLIAVKLADGRYVKVELISYYKYAPVNILDSVYTDVTSKFYAFRYLVSSSTDWSQQVTTISNLQAISTTDYQMVDFTISDTTINSSARWNFRFRGTTIESNTAGGNTGQLVTSAFNSITTAPTVSSGAISWYNYDMASTHVVSAKPATTIVFKDSLNRFGKIVIESYYKNSEVCEEGRHYTMKYYYNPYGAGENTSGRNGSDLTTSATITQTVPPAFSLSSSTLSVGEAGTSSAETINVTADDSWEVTTAAAWITLGGTTSGSGNASFTITAAANTGASREEDVVIEYCNGATKEVTVSQAGITTEVKMPMAQRTSIYPNPSTGKFNIDLGTLICEEVSVINPEGKQFAKIVNPATLVEINTQEWNKGIYFVRFASAEGFFYKMVEVQ